MLCAWDAEPNQTEKGGLLHIQRSAFRSHVMKVWNVQSLYSLVIFCFYRKEKQSDVFLMVAQEGWVVQWRTTMEVVLRLLPGVGEAWSVAWRQAKWDCSGEGSMLKWRDQVHMAKILNRSINQSTRGGYSTQSWVGVFRWGSEALTLFKTKNSNFHTLFKTLSQFYIPV